MECLPVAHVQGVEHVAGVRGRHESTELRKGFARSGVHHLDAIARRTFHDLTTRDGCHVRRKSFLGFRVPRPVRISCIVKLLDALQLREDEGT